MKALNLGRNLNPITSAGLAMSMALAVLIGGTGQAAAGGYMEFTKEHPRAEPRDDMATVYVMRPTSGAAGVKSFFFMDHEPLGVNRGSSYFFFHAEPGKHVFWSKSENVDAVELEVEAGRTYYLKQGVRPGFFRARTKLLVLDETGGEKALKKCKKHGTITGKGIEKGRQLAEAHMDSAMKDVERQTREAERKTAREAQESAAAEDASSEG